MDNKAFFKMLHPLYNIKEAVDQSQVTPITIDTAVQKGNPSKNEVSHQLPTQHKTIRLNRPNQEEKLVLTYLPCLYIFRLFGICPVTVNRSDGAPKCDFKYLSISFVTSVIGSLGIIYLYIFALPCLKARLIRSPDGNFTLEIKGIGNHSGESVSALLGLLRKLLPMQLPIFTTVNIIVSLVSTPKFVEILQLWSCFEKEFQSQFDTQNSPYAKLYRIRNHFAGVYGAFGLVYVNLVIFVTRPPCDFGVGSSCAIWERIIYAAIVIPYICYIFLEDFKYLIMSKTVSEGFKQISCMIKGYNVDIRQDCPKYEILYEDVIKWEGLLNNVREQGRLVSECSSLHHVMSISSIFFSFVVCLYLFVAFQLNMKPGGTPIAIVAGGFCTAGFLRLLIKVKGSESISDEEKKLTCHLNNATIPSDAIKTQIKINLIIDRVERDPTQIAIFHSYKINSNLLFNLLGQAATYLIFLIQFDSMLQED